MSVSDISTLWNNGKLPVRDALHFARGYSYSVRLNAAIPGGIELLEAFDLNDLLNTDPERLTSIDITREIKISDGAGYLCCGEGSYGSEGFFARLDDRKILTWVVYLEESNPFVDILLDDTKATFNSSSNVSITLDTERPDLTIGKPNVVK